MEIFLREKYPWFLPTFLAYPADIHKGDHLTSNQSRQKGTHCKMAKKEWLRHPRTPLGLSMESLPLYQKITMLILQS